MNKTRGMRLGEADIRLLADVGQYGLLDSEQLASFYPKLKPNSVYKRVARMVDQGLLKSVRIRVYFDDKKTGRPPVLYTLTSEGGDMVEKLTFSRPPRIRTSEPSAMTIWHRHDEVRVMRSIDQACEQLNLPVPSWVMEQDGWREAPKDLPPNQRRLLYHSFNRENVCVTCNPDLACRLRLPGGEVALFFEVDRSSEGQKQVGSDDRILGYEHLFRQRGFERYWSDFDSTSLFTVWVCKSQSRINNLCKTLKKFAIAERFRFALLESFAHPESLLTTPRFSNVLGEPRVLYTPT